MDLFYALWPSKGHLLIIHQRSFRICFGESKLIKFSPGWTPFVSKVKWPWISLLVSLGDRPTSSWIGAVMTKGSAQVGSTQWTQGVWRWPSIPAFASPTSTPVAKDFHQSLLLALLERRRVLNDVSILPPSLQLHYYNKAALRIFSQTCSISLVWGGTWGTGCSISWRSPYLSFGPGWGGSISLSDVCCPLGKTLVSIS